MVWIDSGVKMDVRMVLTLSGFVVFRMSLDQGFRWP